MAQLDYIGGGSFTSEIDGNTPQTVTLVGAGPNTFQRITDIIVHAAGTVTAYSVLISKNDGSTVIAKFGGQVGAATTGPMGPGPYSFQTPVNCAVNDNAKVTVTATGATAGTVFVTVNYILGSK